MKLLLTSTGFANDAIAQTAVRLVGKPAEQINIAVINEGYVYDVGNRWAVRELVQGAAAFGGVYDLVNLLALTELEYMDRLEAADLFFVLGGYTDYLMNVFNRTGLSRRLPRWLETKVYVGSSAGSAIVGLRVNQAGFQKLYGEGDDYALTSYLELVDFATKSHLDRPGADNNRTEIVARRRENL